MISEIGKFMTSLPNILFGYSNQLNDLDLLTLDIAILILQLVEFLDQHIDFVAILRDFIQTITLKLLLFKLNMLILFLQVPELVLECVIISLPALELIYFSC